MSRAAGQSPDEISAREGVASTQFVASTSRPAALVPLSLSNHLTDLRKRRDQKSEEDLKMVVQQEVPRLLGMAAVYNEFLVWRQEIFNSESVDGERRRCAPSDADERLRHELDRVRVR